ncbi:AbgT family transporter [Parendozoicomonas haliclonae]|uniref:p-aminobenzoyl-glutamate transport protein n=1 Tax=Parendozoicomonas haliclonae TaxID=1960125 RepID=A0A1X7ARP4_9GAMM|nr:AbgT family transporter [Parendozoicomonas haliclonae]SMA50905.1 p-aminobenzoyl-glutamate transport protein [Parendozoicomonas haliclonae]
MSSPDLTPTAGVSARSFFERVGHAIPDPVIIFIFLYVVCLIVSASLGGTSFVTPAANGETSVHTIRNMFSYEGIFWIFQNAVLQNWLAFGGGVLGVILVVMLGVGIAEESGLLAALIKKVALQLNERWLPALLVFLGIMSSLASDAGYLILIPLAGMLYAGMGKNPIVGMAAAFAGVSAGFSANLIPATPIDVIIGMNARLFAEQQGVPFTRIDGTPLQPATMHYWFIVASTFLLTICGGLITRLVVDKNWRDKEWNAGEEEQGDFSLSALDHHGLKWALVGLIISAVLVTWLCQGPLASFYGPDGKKITPWLNNVILLITLVFAICGICFGIGTRRFTKASDIVIAMTKQMDTMGYILVLTFFCYNFLSLLNYSGLGAWITWLGARGLQILGLQSWPVLLLIGFILTTGVINLFVGGLTSKWMLLGPIFVPMLYQVSATMTPDIVAAAFRVADSSTNIVTPMMTYAGVVLSFMRRYRPDLSPGDLISIMWPYTAVFLVSWTALLVVFFVMRWPLGF